VGVPLQRPSLPQCEALGDGRQLGAKRVEVLERLSYFLMSVLVKTPKVKLGNSGGSAWPWALPFPSLASPPLLRWDDYGCTKAALTPPDF
jgi:hypothetical protein